MNLEQAILTAVFSALVSFATSVFLYRHKRKDERKSRLDASICSQISFAIALLESDIGLMKRHLETFPQEVVPHPLTELPWATSFSDMEKAFFNYPSLSAGMLSYLLDRSHSIRICRNGMTKRTNLQVLLDEACTRMELLQRSAALPIESLQESYQSERIYQGRYPENDASSP